MNRKRMEPIRVLQSVNPPRATTNPYLTQLGRELQQRTSMNYFTWRRALLGSYDVLHVHWPEILLRGAGRPRDLIRRPLLALLTVRLSWSRRTALVRTLHNLSPHEPPGRLDRALLAAFNRQTDLWIDINGHLEPPSSAPVVTIPHAHYRDWYADAPRYDREPHRLLFFGHLRRYKGIPELLGSFGAVAPDASLHIVGQVHDEEIASVVRTAVDSDSRVTADLSYVSDETLSAEIGRSSLVVLPYREFENSGALLLALSLDRPVLVPQSPLTSSLAAEVGPGWVTTYSGPLTAATLQQALTDSAAMTGRPRFQNRDWAEIGQAHVAAYEMAVDHVSSRAGTADPVNTPPTAGYPEP